MVAKVGEQLPINRLRSAYPQACAEERILPVLEVVKRENTQGENNRYIRKYQGNGE